MTDDDLDLVVIDELDNSEIVAYGVWYPIEHLVQEQARCDKVIQDNVLTGVNLDYWHDRIQLLETARRWKEQHAE